MPATAPARGTAAPKHWRDDPRGALFQAFTRYLDGARLSDDEVAVIRDHLVRWMLQPERTAAPGVTAARVVFLARQVRRVETARHLDLWLADAICDGLDPL